MYLYIYRHIYLMFYVCAPGRSASTLTRCSSSTWRRATASSRSSQPWGRARERVRVHTSNLATLRQLATRRLLREAHLRYPLVRLDVCTLRGHKAKAAARGVRVSLGSLASEGDGDNRWGSDPLGEERQLASCGVFLFALAGARQSVARGLGGSLGLGL